MITNSPYQYYDNKLGFKVSFIVSDGNNEKSLNLIKGRTLRSRMASKTSTEKRLRYPCLNHESLILFSSLSPVWREQIVLKFGEPKKEIKKSWFSENYFPDKNAYDFYISHRFGKNNAEKLDLKFVELYTYNASVLNTVLLMKENRKEYIKALGGVKVDIWDSLSRDVNAFREVPHNLPTTRDSLRHKATRYAKESYLSLISGKLKNSNAKKVTQKEQLALLDELLAKHTNLDNELVCTIYNTVAKQMKWPEITSGTVANRKNKSSLVTNAGRNGRKALKNNVLMQNKRRAPSAPMLYWTMDGWDSELLYQKPSINKDGHKVVTYHHRLTIVVILDPFNKYPVGYAIGTHETPALIKKALQNAINHTKELFGAYQRPFQLQSDNYSVKKLRPIYKACTENFTPASVGNAKAKVIEPYFNHINKTYCRLFDNWSGFNTNSGSKNQPNDEMLNKLRHSFPDEQGVVEQLTNIMEMERSKKQKDFVLKWADTKEEHRSEMSFENYLLTFGSNTGDTNRLEGSGLNVTINGIKRNYDCFEVGFREHLNTNWKVLYDEHDLNKVLAVSEDGQHRYELQEKYIQPMALADQCDDDEEQLKKVKNYNKSVENHIKQQRADNSILLEEFFEDNPQLNDTVAKHVLTNSLGQHKNLKNANKINQQAKKKTIQIEAKQEATNFKEHQKAQQEYHNEKVNIDDYLN